MPFSPGQSGNPGGKRKALGLSRAVRKSEGMKTWAKLLAIRDDMVLERKEIGKDKDGKPFMVDVVPSVKVLLDVHKLIIAYTSGTPVAQGQDDIEQRIAALEKAANERPPYRQ